MSIPIRVNRSLWVAAGLILMVVTVVGASWALNSPGQVADSSSPNTPAGIIALAFVDVEGGLVHPYPLQPNRVVEVTVKEGQKVKKGTVLLKLDRKLAEEQKKEAEAALEDVQQQLRKASLLPEKHVLDIAMQEQAVEAARGKKSAAEKLKDKAKRLVEAGALGKEDLAAAQEDVKTVEALVRIEEKKLEQLKLLDPKIDVDRAHADVKAKKAQLEKADWALSQCDLLAPEDGEVLRIFCQAGDVLGPSPKMPAIQFRPDGQLILRAEVLQEWARYVKDNQEVIIEDDTYQGPQWKGRIKRLSNWYTHKRNIMLEPFMVNDVRTLEAIVEVSPGGPPLLIGQRVRVVIQPKPGT